MSIQDLASLVQNELMEAACEGGEYYQCGRRG
jgi:hypothetical protein